MADLGNPIDAWMQMAQAKNRNRQQMNQDIAGIGQGLGQGFNTIAQQMQEKQKKAAWQKTINEMMVNPNVPPQMKTMLPIFAQHPELMGNLGAALSKQPTQKSVYRPFPGTDATSGEGLVIDESTGKVKPIGLQVKTANKFGNMDNVTWENASQEDKDLAQAVYEGRVDPNALSYRDKTVAVRLANEVPKKTGGGEPFQSYTAQTKAAMAKSLSSGKLGANALALNTAMGHAKSALDAYKAVANTNQKWLNRPINYLRTQTNDPNIVKLQLSLNALSGELATVFKGSAGTDQEIGKFMEVLSKDLTPIQAVGVIRQANDLLNSRLSALQYQQGNVMGAFPSQRQLLSPHAAAVSKEFEGLGKQKNSFASVQEAEASGLPVGTKVTINGRPATIQ